MSLFNETELEAASNVLEPAYFRDGWVVTRNRKTKREELLMDIPVMEFPCMVHPDEMCCGECGGPIKEIGFTKVCDEIQYIPTKVKIIRYMQPACECLVCKHSDHPYIQKAAIP